MKTIEERKKEVVTIDRYTIEPPFPTEIFLDLTSFCNHACIFCSNPRLKNKVTMKREKVYKMLREAYDSGVRDIGMYATGESFLVKNLAEYIAEAKRIGYKYIFITTNGSLVDEKIGKPVLDAGLDSLKISISAGTRKTYKIIQGKDDFDKVIENLKWVFRYRKESGLKYRIYVTMVYTDVTKNEVDILKKIVMPYIDEWDPHPMNNQCGNMYENNQLGKIEANNPGVEGVARYAFSRLRVFR